MTGDVRLDVDDEIEVLLDEALGDRPPDPDGVQHNEAQDHIASMMAADATRTTWGMARAAKRLRDELDAIERERRMVVAEYVRRAVAVHAQLRFLDSVISDHAKAERERTDGRVTFVEFPTVGRWSTTARSSSFEITDEAALVAWLSDEGREAMRDLFIKSEPELRWGELKKALPGIIADHGGEMPTGIGRTEATVTVSSPVLPK